MMNRPSFACSPARRAPRRSKESFGSLRSKRRNGSQATAARPAKVPTPMPKTSTLSPQTQRSTRNANQYQGLGPALSP